MTDEEFDADALRRLRRAVTECPRPELVRIVDSGLPVGIGAPRYRLVVLDTRPEALQAVGWSPKLSK